VPTGALAGVLGRWWTWDACTECSCLVHPGEERCAGCDALLVGRFSNGAREIEPRYQARMDELKRLVAERERLKQEEAADLERAALNPPD
jgi:hypothetical protein